MRLAIDFDGTLVSQDRAYDDVETPLVIEPGVVQALRSFRRAGHQVLLYSARTNRALLDHYSKDPLVRAGVKRVDRTRWERNVVVNLARVQQMERFCQERLGGLYDAIDDGHQGKPGADVYIDDRAVQYGGAGGYDWVELSRMFGA